MVQIFKLCLELYKFYISVLYVELYNIFLSCIGTGLVQRGDCKRRHTLWIIIVDWTLKFIEANKKRTEGPWWPIEI